MLASMWEFYSYASDPKAHIFFFAVVTGAIALFVQLEFGHRVRNRGLGSPFPGMASLAGAGVLRSAGGHQPGKGPAVRHVDGRGADWLFPALERRLGPYSPLHLAMGLAGLRAIALAWPIAAYLHCPDILNVWYDDYVGRLNEGYIGEPFWYYLAVFPWVLLPWTPPALVGLVGVICPAFREASGRRISLVLGGDYAGILFHPGREASPLSFAMPGAVGGAGGTGRRAYLASCGAKAVVGTSPAFGRTGWGLAGDAVLIDTPWGSCRIGTCCFPRCCWPARP